MDNSEIARRGASQLAAISRHVARELGIEDREEIRVIHAGLIQAYGVGRDAAKAEVHAQALADAADEEARHARMLAHELLTQEPD